jgi:hypothetical protein
MKEGTLAATIVHFGEDPCFRVPVLRSAGYTVAACESLDQLAILLSGDAEAIAFEDEPDFPTREAVALARARSSAPVVLFRNVPELLVPDEFDLVIPSLTAPEDWLKKIANLLEHSRAIRAASQTLHQTSASLREDSAAIRAQTRRIRERSIWQRSSSTGDDPVSD